MTDRAQPVAPHRHAVSFYDHETDLVAETARFIADGLDQGERVVVLATAEHRAALDEVLLQYGTDTVRARVTGRYLTLDAAETLEGFLVDGAPDPARFRATVAPIVAAAGEDGCPVRLFGEMVALLWAAGNVTGAIALEQMWNELATSHQFALLCAYPIRVLAAGSLGAADQICSLHSSVVAPRSYADGEGRLEATIDDLVADDDAAEAIQRSQLFIPVAAAVPAARRFVDGVLRSWGEAELLADAALIVSELATNAVKHAGSPFRVVVRRGQGIVRVSIDDVSAALPELADAAPDAFGGRGVAIVADLAMRWGCHPLPDGKSVWAELPGRGPRRPEPAADLR